ncbi:hypothetical protein BDA96_10G279500 [Sorghum bicolor]|uniref:Uncharacterized protein n=1 Tax=Sorghum bicolor TaxID=4558 RepID=A0A921U288_SORBI|nr:hypothetical protein BDA96_10G279500 [Sorghum bicolor]
MPWSMIKECVSFAHFVVPEWKGTSQELQYFKSSPPPPSMFSLSFNILTVIQQANCKCFHSLIMCILFLTKYSLKRA